VEARHAGDIMGICSILNTHTNITCTRPRNTTLTRTLHIRPHKSGTDTRGGGRRNKRRRLTKQQGKVSSKDNHRRPRRVWRNRLRRRPRPMARLRGRGKAEVRSPHMHTMMRGMRRGVIGTNALVPVRVQEVRLRVRQGIESSWRR
jgi:hypothetical protein